LGHAGGCWNVGACRGKKKMVRCSDGGEVAAMATAVAAMATAVAAMATTVAFVNGAGMEVLLTVVFGENVMLLLDSRKDAGGDRRKVCSYCNGKDNGTVLPWW